MTISVGLDSLFQYKYIFTRPLTKCSMFEGQWLLSDTLRTRKGSLVFIFFRNCRCYTVCYVYRFYINGCGFLHHLSQQKTKEIGLYKVLILFVASPICIGDVSLTILMNETAYNIPFNVLGGRIRIIYQEMFFFLMDKYRWRLL